MTRRFAILDDNDRVLAERLDALAAALPMLLRPRVAAAVVIGSVAEGLARDESDVDVVLVLADEEPRRAHYRWWDAEVAPQLPREPRFPVQPLFIGRESVHTGEPTLRAGLEHGIRLWDPEGLLDDQSSARA